jgi:hypothetical protein
MHNVFYAHRYAMKNPAARFIVSGAGLRQYLFGVDVCPGSDFGFALIDTPQAGFRQIDCTALTSANQF